MTGTAVIYSNVDHVLRDDIVAQLEAHPDWFAQHAAWDFCGWVWRDADGRWHEQVMVYGAEAAVLDGATPLEVIAQANGRFGYR